MSEIVVQQPSGDWAIFSTIVDGFIMEDSSKKEVIRYYVAEEKERIQGKLDAIALGDYEQRHISLQSYEDCKNREEERRSEAASVGLTPPDEREINVGAVVAPTHECEMDECDNAASTKREVRASHNIPIVKRVCESCARMIDSR